MFKYNNDGNLALGQTAKTTNRIFSDKINKIKNFIARHSVWFICFALALLLLKPSGPELNTLLLIIAFSALSLALSGLAAYVYTKLDFVESNASTALALIFLGVHIFSGLCILGVYIAQFSGY